MDVYSVKAASELTGISRPSLRVYTQRYSRWLSTEATPGPGQARTFTADDLRTLRFVYEQTQSGQTHDQVIAKLDAGELESYAWQAPASELAEPAQEPQGAALLPAQATILQLFEEYRQREDALRERVRELSQQLGEAQGRLAEAKSGRWQAPPWLRALIGGRRE